jgi:hypothetical protein
MSRVFATILRLKCTEEFVYKDKIVGNILFLSCWGDTKNSLNFMEKSAKAHYKVKWVNFYK